MQCGGWGPFGAHFSGNAQPSSSLLAPLALPPDHNPQLIPQEVADWAACRVLDCNEAGTDFLIQWIDTGREKWVKRLNILFDEEDPGDWQERLEEAINLRAKAEACPIPTPYFRTQAPHGYMEEPIPTVLAPPPPPPPNNNNTNNSATQPK